MYGPLKVLRKSLKIVECAEFSMKSDAIAFKAGAASYELGPILVNVASRQIWRSGEIVVVPSKSVDALIYLAAHPDRTVTKDELISAVWEGMFVSEDSL